MLCGLTFISYVSVAACNRQALNTSESTRTQEGEHGSYGYLNADGGNGGSSDWGRGGAGGNCRGQNSYQLTRI